MTIGTIHKGGRFYLCTTPQPNTLTQVEFEALSYVEIVNVVEAPGFDVEPNIISENYLGSQISEKQKGFETGADTTVVTGHIPGGNVDHDAMIAAAATGSTYAVKYELDDALNDTGTGTTTYARVLIGGGKPSPGAGEDYVRRTFTLSVTSQRPIEVAATAGA